MLRLPVAPASTSAAAGASVAGGSVGVAEIAIRTVAGSVAVGMGCGAVGSAPSAVTSGASVSDGATPGRVQPATKTSSANSAIEAVLNRPAFRDPMGKSPPWQVRLIYPKRL